MTSKKVLLVVLAVAAIGVLIVSVPEYDAVPQATSTGARVPGLHGPAMSAATPMKSDFPSLAGATGWINSAPLSPADLRGKVVLVDFWTYTCVNWLRTLPYIRAWAEKYKNDGLVVIGVHSPEFEFEKNLENIRRAVKDMGIVYPVAIDSNHEVWRAFRNEAWPALYFIDAQGRMRHRYFGEGEYEESERLIQTLLVEAGSRSVNRDLVSVQGRGLETAADWTTLKSPESYLSYERTENFASAGGAVSGKPRVYSVPGRLTLNAWALSGDWTFARNAVVLNKANGRIVYRFHARDVNLVMGPATAGKPVRFRVLLDGRPAAISHGTDVDSQGNGTVAEQRTYQLIRQRQPIAERQFEIEFLDPGVEAFAFTFG
jgi:thiol-disulfide isomerase/thioredoxin